MLHIFTWIIRQNPNSPSAAIRLVGVDLAEDGELTKALEYLSPSQYYTWFPHILQAELRCKEPEVRAGDWSLDGCLKMEHQTMLRVVFQKWNSTHTRFADFQTLAAQNHNLNSRCRFWHPEWVSRAFFPRCQEKCQRTFITWVNTGRDRLYEILKMASTQKTCRETVRERRREWRVGGGGEVRWMLRGIIVEGGWLGGGIKEWMKLKVVRLRGVEKGGRHGDERERERERRGKRDV